MRLGSSTPVHLQSYTTTTASYLHEWQLKIFKKCSSLAEMLNIRFSVYYMNLNKAAKERYLSKLSVLDKHDLYLLKGQDITKDIACFTTIKVRYLGFFLCIQHIEHLPTLVTAKQVYKLQFYLAMAILQSIPCTLQALHC